MAEIKYTIKENSLLARVAAIKLRSGSAAIVLGNTIHLHNCSKDEFLKNERWLKHEICHIRQFQKFGFSRFILMYLAESIRKGYHNNRFEVEAREAENS